MKYRPEIDGLRTVAVVPVILFHAGYGLFSGGFVGVDVFFVISGYLITTIIHDEVRAGRFSIARFYERRARRILPALFVISALCIPVALAIMTPSDLKYFARSLLSVLAFVSNIFFWQEANYFDSAVELKPLLHTWSLAVEEQFYVLFPLFAMIVFRLRAGIVLAALVAVSAASFAVAYWGSYASPTAAFYLLPTRGWELLAGSILAVLLAGRDDFGAPRWLNEAFSLAGLGLIFYAVFTYSAATRFPGAAAIPPVAGAALIIGFARPGTLAHRLLSLRAMVGIGLISYSAYLWHQPLFAFTRYLMIDAHPSPWLMGVLSIAVFPLAWATWRFVEAPFRQRGRITLRPLVTRLSAAAAVLAVFGLAGSVTGGFPARGVGVQIGAYDDDNKALRMATWGPLRARSGDPGYLVDNNPFDRTLWFDADDPRTRLLVVGNSFSKDIYNELHHSASAQARFQVARFGAELRWLESPGTGFFTAPNYREADIVLLATRWRPGDLRALPGLIDRLTADGKRVALATNGFEFREFYNRSLADILLLRAQRAGDLAQAGPDLIAQINRQHYADYRAGIGSRPEAIAIDAEIRRIGAAEGVPVLDRMDYICRAADQACDALGPDFVKYIPDYGHHTLAGTAWFGARMDAVDWLAPLSGHAGFD